jgi:tRNA pseudouridine55 synthase
LGFSTDTYDSTGKSTSSESKEYPKKFVLLESMNKFVGKIEQVSPPYSAKKYKGKPLYKLVRGKKAYELKTSKITVYSFDLIQFTPPELEFKVRCSSGTYIRSLAHDLGLHLECGAHLSELIRTAIGEYRLDESMDLEKIQHLNKEGKIEEFLIPLEFLLPEFPKIILNERGSVLAKNGNKVFPECILKIIHDESYEKSTSKTEEPHFRMFSLEGKFLALARRSPDKNDFHPFLVIDAGNEGNLPL